MSGDLDIAHSETVFEMMGYGNPTPERLRRHAAERVLLGNLQKVKGANVSGQTGKWDLSSAQTIHEDFNHYLNRRIQGQHARWTARGRS
jgi:hypothetical protein